MRVVSQGELERKIARDLALGKTFNQVMNKYKVSGRRVNTVIHRFNLKDWRSGLVRVSKIKKDMEAFKITIPIKVVKAMNISKGDVLHWEVRKDGDEVYAIVRKVDEKLIDEYLSKS